MKNRRSRARFLHYEVQERRRPVVPKEERAEQSYDDRLPADVVNLNDKISAAFCYGDPPPRQLARRPPREKSSSSAEAPDLVAVTLARYGVKLSAK